MFGFNDFCVFLLPFSFVYSTICLLILLCCSCHFFIVFDSLHMFCFVFSLFFFFYTPWQKWRHPGIGATTFDILLIFFLVRSTCHRHWIRFWRYQTSARWTKWKQNVHKATALAFVISCEAQTDRSTMCLAFFCASQNPIYHLVTV